MVEAEQGHGKGTQGEVEGLSLAVVRGPDSGVSAVFFQERVVLGRKDGDFVLADRETSSLHAAVERAPGERFVLKDMGSTNGTFLDGRRVNVVELKPGQQFRCGANTILFRLGEEVDDDDRTAGPPIASPAPYTPDPGHAGRTTDVSPKSRLDVESVSRRNAATTTMKRPNLPKPEDQPATTSPAGMTADAVLIPPAGKLAPKPAAAPVPPQASAPLAPAGQAASTERTPAPEQVFPHDVKPSARGAYLVALEGRDKGKVFSLQHAEVMIGRADAEVRLADPDVSRRHARLELAGDKAAGLRDLASTNGTMVNGEAFVEGQILDGDRIRVGDTVLELVFGDQRLAAALKDLRH